MTRPNLYQRDDTMHEWSLNQIKSHCSIKTILIVSLSAVILFVGFSTAMVYYYHALEKEQSRMHQFMHNESTTFPIELAWHLWKYDLDGVRRLCKERLKDTRIQSIKIIDEENHVVFQSVETDHDPSLFFTEPIMYANQKIGMLSISFTRSNIATLEKNILATAAAMLFFIICTAIAALLVLTNVLVVSPFSQIAYIINEMKQERYEWTFRGRSLKEIQPIINGLKKLSQELLERSQRIKADTHSLQEYNQTLLDEIDRRKAAEIALKKQEQKLRFSIDESPIGICTVDLDGNIVSSNQAYERMLGYSKDELKELSFFAITHPDDISRNRKLFQDMRSMETPGFDIEKIYIRKDGAQINVRLHAAPIKDEEGNTLMGTAFVEDITFRKQAETELIQSKELIESVLNGISAPVFVKNEKHRWIMLNDAFCTMFDKKREKLLGKSDCDHFPKNLTDKIWEHDNTILDSNKPGVYEERIAFGKQTRTIFCQKAPFTNPITGATNIVGILRDITDDKRMEEQFRQAQKMDSVGRLAGGIAHDFNNMLGVILGHTELLLEHQDISQPIIDGLKEIKKAADHSAELTRQLLAFARKQTVTPKILDINLTVEGMLKMVGRLIGEDIDLVWAPCSTIWPIKIDPNQIDQIMVNLCVNARDAIENNGKLTIETSNTFFDKAYCEYHAGFTQGEYVLLAVSDNGCGMDAETLDTIFEPFFTTKKVGMGTGLGLATIYGIVKQNNGFINVYSEPDKGTTFKIYLPRYIGSYETLKEEAPMEQPKKGKETILLVEDEPAILKMATMMLEGLGYTVMAAATPDEAIHHAEAYPDQIQLLMTDVIMPEMNGNDLAKKILTMYPNLKRLFMSGYTANVIAHHGVLDEGVNFIQKPFSIQDLATKLREVFDS